MSSTARELLNAHPEHEVTFLCYGPEQELAQSKHPKLKVIPFQLNPPLEPKRRDEIMVEFGTDNFQSLGNLLSEFAKTYDLEIKMYEKLIKLGNKPDFVVIDFFVTSAYDFFTFHKTPYATFYHCFVFGIFGIEDPFNMPDMMIGTTLKERSFMNRLTRVSNFVRTVKATSEFGALTNAARKRHGFPEYMAPDTNIIGHPILAMTSFGLEYARKLNPLTKLVGFFYDVSEQRIKPSTNDDFEVLKWIESDSKPNVVYVAFGTEQFMTKEEILAVVKGIITAKHRVILVVRSELRNLYGISDADFTSFEKNSVLFVLWARQPMILAHSQVAVFVSHGGAASIGESIYARKPLVILPKGADREGNAARLQDKGVGIYIKQGFTSSQIEIAVKELSGNQKAKEKLEWIVRVNEHTGGGAPGAAKEIQNLVEDGYEHLIPTNWDLNPLASTGADLIIFFLVTQIAIIAILFRIIKSVCCAGTRGKKTKSI